MTNALAIRDDMPLAEIATAFVKSGFFQDTRDVSQAIVKIMAGREFGFGPFASMNGIHIIQGRPSLGADLMGKAVKSSGRYNYMVREMSATACRIEFFENGKSIGTSEFTADDARKAGTKNMDKYPRNMLFARAMSNGVRWYCPDVFGSAVYTPEEMGAEVDEEGNVVNAAFVATPAPAAATVIEQPPAAKPNGNGHASDAMDLAWAREQHTPKGARYGDLTREQLEYIMLKGKEAERVAAQLILDSMAGEPPMPEEPPA